MRPDVDGSGYVTAWEGGTEDDASFAVPPPHGVPLPTDSGWQVTGSAPTRILSDPQGHLYAAEVPDQPLPGSADLGGGGGGSQPTVTVDLDTAELANLGDPTILLVAAAGAGKAIIPTAAVFEYVAGSDAFFYNAFPTLVYGATGDFSLAGWQTGVAVPVDETDSVVAPLVPQGTNVPLAAIDNQPLYLAVGELPPGYSGPILTSEINNGGSGFAENDTFTLEQDEPGATGATGVVDTVDGGGAILTYHLTATAGKYGTQDSATVTATSGVGVDATVTILTIDPESNGSARITVTYFEMDLA